MRGGAELSIPNKPLLRKYLEFHTKGEPASTQSRLELPIILRFMLNTQPRRRNANELHFARCDEKKARRARGADPSAGARRCTRTPTAPILIIIGGASAFPRPCRAAAIATFAGRRVRSGSRGRRFSGADLLLGPGAIRRR